MVKRPVYLDYNATTPVDPRVLETMLPFFTIRFGNAASRSHLFGRDALDAVEEARMQVARLIGAEAGEIIFTSGATESVNLALKGAFEMYRSRGNHIITLETEHKAVLDTCTKLAAEGAEITRLGINQDGLVNLETFESAFRPTTVIVCVMLANNETGVIQPLKQLAEIASRNGAIVFSDATQAIGKVPVLVNDEGIDMMAFSAHKLYGPKGVGALYVRRKSPRVRLVAQIDGGGHERGMRSGTLNVPGIAGFGKACELAMLEMNEESARLEKLRNRIEESLLMLEETNVNGHTNIRLPHVCNLLIRHIESGALIQETLNDIAISTGSACSSATAEPSHVLKAMGLNDRDAASSVRISLGRFTSDEEVDFAIETLKHTISRLREESAVWQMYKEAGNGEKFERKPH